MLVLGGGCKLAFGGGHDGICPGADGLVKIVSFEEWPHNITDDLAGGYVRQNPLKPHADLDTYLAFGLGQHQQHAVVFALLADLPLLDHPDGELVDVVTL